MERSFRVLEPQTPPQAFGCCCASDGFDDFAMGVKCKTELENDCEKY